MGKQKDRRVRLFVGMLERMGKGDLRQAEREMWRMPASVILPLSEDIIEMARSLLAAVYAWRATWCRHIQRSSLYQERAYVAADPA
jgi:hypothetical protein